MLDHDFSHGRRAGIAIINLVFIFGNALTELGANVIPFGADFMSLFPRWLNIKRGMWMCYILGVAICPWQILATATGFLKFLNGYSIFLGPFLGMALTDYLVVRKGNVFVRDLYQVGGRYWYFHGVSWRPIVTWLFSVAFMVRSRPRREIVQVLITTPPFSFQDLRRHLVLSWPKVVGGHIYMRLAGFTPALSVVWFILPCLSSGIMPTRKGPWHLRLWREQRHCRVLMSRARCLR